MEQDSELCRRAAGLLERTNNSVTPEEAEPLRDEARQAGDTPAEAMALQALCMAYYEQGRVEECLAAAREAQTLFERVRDVAGQAQALLTIAEVRLAASWGHDIARRSAQKARGLFRQVGPEYDHGVVRAAVLQCQAQVRVLLERPVHVHTEAAWAEALKATQEAEDLARGIDDLGLAATALLATAQAQMANKRHQAALRAARAAADLHSTTGSPHDVTKALLLAVEAAAASGKRKEARQLGLRAKDIAQEVADTTLSADVAKALESVGQDSLLANLEEAEKLAVKKPGVRTQVRAGAEEAAGAKQEVPLREILTQVLGSDMRTGAIHRSPLLRAGPPAPYSPFSTNQFLTLGQNQQANAVLALMKSTDMETFHLRPMTASVDPAEVKAARDAADDAIWVAPVRKRMEGGAQARPPLARTGVNLRRLSPWAN